MSSCRGIPEEALGRLMDACRIRPGHAHAFWLLAGAPARSALLR